ncbi:MAG: DtxR family transcriptional regulator, Mn-dependent transcriptional regulator [Actinomycetota bacterium]|jgi:DtxR family Mn-dependent transcriptional regulator|nr:DtxR family transcriptional regulator, Mn-dependent transcriptional regulator [Actinomycetota bacterium]
MSTHISQAAEDYLKALLLEGEGQGTELVSTTALAGRMGVSAASATNMLKKLAGLGLVEHLPYRGARLTDAGRRVALEVVRHHRLLETYLAEALGVPWDEVHAEAEVLEHVLSERLEERISSLLGDPKFDPHGHPIPSKDLAMPRASERHLWSVGPGEKVAVDRVSDTVPEALRYLGRVGIRPGTLIEVIERGPVNGPLYVRVAGDETSRHALSRELAEAVWVA